MKEYKTEVPRYDLDKEQAVIEFMRAYGRMPENEKELEEFRSKYEIR